MDTLGKRLIAVGEARGAETTEDRARYCDISPSSLRDYETDRRIPGGEAIVWLCQAYQCSADWLLGLVKAPRSSDCR